MATNPFRTVLDLHLDEAADGLRYDLYTAHSQKRAAWIIGELVARMAPNLGEEARTILQEEVNLAFQSTKAGNTLAVGQNWRSKTTTEIASLERVMDDAVAFRSYFPGQPIGWEGFLGIRAFLMKYERVDSLAP